MKTTFTVVTQATWICKHCDAQQTYTGVDAQIQATACGMNHMANVHPGMS